MNTTIQLKKLNKEKREQDTTLVEINKKLDFLINEIGRLKTQSYVSLTNKDINDIEEKMRIKSEDKYYIPEVDIEGMEVKAGVKNIDNKKDIVGNIDKLKKLGG